nr:Ada metal-binding domain-containing protein [uncultured Desulfobacter sp.]
MKKFIIGALVLLVGVPGFALTFPNFLNFLAGVIPAVLILGGAVAVYLGFEESKQSDDSGTTVETEIELGAERLAKYAEKSKEVSEPALNEQDTTPAPEPTEEAEDAAPEAQEAATKEVQFKGNIETLVFHTVDCNFASGKNCSMDFTSKEEAETQGYKPCKICMPDS